MSKISINDIRPAGADLFADSESYLRDLTDHEVTVTGGALPITLTTVTLLVVATAYLYYK